MVTLFFYAYWPTPLYHTPLYTAVTTLPPLPATHAATVTFYRYRVLRQHRTRHTTATFGFPLVTAYTRFNARASLLLLFSYTYTFSRLPLHTLRVPLHSGLRCSIFYTIFVLFLHSLPLDAGAGLHHSSPLILPLISFLQILFDFTFSFHFRSQFTVHVPLYLASLLPVAHGDTRSRLHFVTLHVTRFSY